MSVDLSIASSTCSATPHLKENLLDVFTDDSQYSESSSESEVEWVHPPLPDDDSQRRRILRNSIFPVNYRHDRSDPFSALSSSNPCDLPIPTITFDEELSPRSLIPGNSLVVHSVYNGFCLLSSNDGSSGIFRLPFDYHNDAIFSWPFGRTNRSRGRAVGKVANCFVSTRVGWNYYQPILVALKLN
jgi:hypothetical protein